MLNREQRTLLVVPYAPPPPPRGHLVAGISFLFVGAIAVLLLAMAEYSAANTAALVVTGAAALFAAALMFILGVRARRRYRLEVEPGVEAVPVQPVGQRSESAEAI